MEAWNPCLQEAMQLLAFVGDIGVQVKVGADAEYNAVLRVRDPAQRLTPGLRAMMLARQDDVLALFERYDQWRAGRPGPLRDAACWTDAVTSLIDWLGFGMGEELSAEFFAECAAMRLVWDSRARAAERKQ